MRHEYPATIVPPGDVLVSILWFLLCTNAATALKGTVLSCLGQLPWSYSSPPGNSVMHIQSSLQHQNRSDCRGCKDWSTFVSFPVQQLWREKKSASAQSTADGCCTEASSCWDIRTFSTRLKDKEGGLEETLLGFFPLDWRVEETRDELSGGENTSKKDVPKASFMNLLQYYTGAVLYIFNRCFT